MAFTENISDFINPDTPGYAVAQYLGEDVGILFDNGFATQFTAEGTNPFATVQTSDFPGVAQDSLLTVNAVEYVVTGMLPDGLGVVVLDLAVNE